LLWTFVHICEDTSNVLTYHKRASELSNRETETEEEAAWTEMAEVIGKRNGLTTLPLN